MQIRVLGCSGSIGGECRTTSFLLDSDVLIDAGTGVGDLTLDELIAIDHILISHSHLDHVLAIGAAGRQRDAPPQRAATPIQVHALPATIDALRTHIFNGVIWPDFTRLPSAEAPLLKLDAVRGRADRSRSASGASRCCRPNTRCPRSALPCSARQWPSAAPSSSPATPGPTPRCGRACTACASRRS